MFHWPADTTGVPHRHSPCFIAVAMNCRQSHNAQALGTSGVARHVAH
jgi:hypothetical protein